MHIYFFSYGNGLYLDIDNDKPLKLHISMIINAGPLKFLHNVDLIMSLVRNKFGDLDIDIDIHIDKSLKLHSSININARALKF